MELKQVQVSDSLEEIARIGVVFFKQVANGAVSSPLRVSLDEFASELRQTMGDRRPSDLEPVQRTRKLYHLVGVDPTRDRPSSERLLRRVVQGRPIPKVNKLVDAMNLVSLQHQCPIGIYDWGAIAPPVLVRIGRPDERFEGTAGEWVPVEGRLVVGGGEGLFGSPSRDSARTAVTLGTVRAFGLAWAPAEAPREYLERVLADMIANAEKYCDAKVSEFGII